MPDTPHPALRELADAGSLCTNCGGVHVAAIDSAIAVITTAEKTRLPLPWCDCVECPECSAFRNFLTALITTSSAGSPTANQEDSK